MSTDIRIVKTRRNIESHFIQLLSQFDFNDITIKLLTTTCQINKTTFYRNYADKYDLLNKVSTDLLGHYIQVVDREPTILTGDPSYLIPIIDYFEQNQEALLILLHRPLPITLFDDMLTVFQSVLLTAFNVKEPDASEKQVQIMSFYARLIAGNILTTIRWQHTEKPLLRKDELISLIMESFEDGVLPSIHEKFPNL
jgi:AcrR family transcriptional regulator